MTDTIMENAKMAGMENLQPKIDEFNKVRDSIRFERKGFNIFKSIKNAIVNDPEMDWLNGKEWLQALWMTCKITFVGAFLWVSVWAATLGYHFIVSMISKPWYYNLLPWNWF